MKWLVGYYATLLVLGLAAGATSLLWVDISITARATVGSLGLGGAGAASNYIRRLYRAGIGGRLVLVDGQEDEAGAFGTLLYLVVRPVIAMLLAFITTVALLTALISATTENAELREGFVYAALLASFTVGFSSGMMLRRLDRRGIEVVESQIGDHL
ncbi:MAG TPA: hypothetical protein VGK17_11070 [Propionicimonas sp.]